MSAPLIAITYHSSEDNDQYVQELSAEKKLKHYYLNILRTQIRKDKVTNGNGGINGGQTSQEYGSDTSDDDSDALDEEESLLFKDSSSHPNDIKAYEYNKISLSKDYPGKYIKNHKIWTPFANPRWIKSNLIKGKKELPADLFDLNHPIPASDLNGESLLAFDDAKFLNYLHLPKLMGQAPLPPLIYHTSCEVDGQIFVLGGATTLIKDNKIPNDLSNYVVDGVNLPKPINSKLLNNPSIIPNEHLYIVSSETSLISRPQITGDIPPPLMAMSASKITSRHIFYYGGFELTNQVAYDANTKKIYIKKIVKLNNSGYVLDVRCLKFKKFELIAHPNMFTRYPLTVPRFGHSSCSVDLSKHLKVEAGAGGIAATVFIMGGFRQDPNDPLNFEPVRDIWKVELSIVYKGKHDYVTFGDNVLATPIPGPVDDNLIPAARAFHCAEIYDASYIHGPRASDNPKKIYNPNRIGIARPSSPASVLSENSTTSTQRNISGDETLDLKLVVHGGSDGKHIFGDTWVFDFDDESWEEISTYFHNYDENSQPLESKYQCQLKRSGHRAILIDKHIYVIGGAMPSDFNDVELDFNEKLPDISSVVASIKGQHNVQNIKDDHYQRLFVLNLATKTWGLIKYFHGILPLIGTSGSLTSFGNIGATVTQSNSKVFVIGGQIVPHHKFNNNSDQYEMSYLNGGIAIFEFPLATSLNSNSKKYW